MLKNSRINLETCSRHKACMLVLMTRIWLFGFAIWFYSTSGSEVVRSENGLLTHSKETVRVLPVGRYIEILVSLASLKNGFIAKCLLLLDLYVPTSIVKDVAARRVGTFLTPPPKFSPS